MRPYWGVDYRSKDSWPRQYLEENGEPYALEVQSLGKHHGTLCIGVWVGPRASHRDVQKWKFLTSSGVKLRILGRPTCSRSLYRLRYRSFLWTVIRLLNRSYCCLSEASCRHGRKLLPSVIADVMTLILFLCDSVVKTWIALPTL